MMAAPGDALLCIDAGNTRIKWGIHDGAWVETGAAPSTEAVLLERVLRDNRAVRSAIASNVAGADVHAQLQDLCVRSGVMLQVIRSEREQVGVVNGYVDPHQLGSDRWAALIGANRARSGHKLVVNVGTALTIDALTADGQFLGGLIVPGPALMRRSLDRGTAGLRLTEGEFREFPGSTPQAITTGAIQACAGAIERHAHAMAARHVAPAHVVLSGGAAREIAPHLSIPHTIIENLVLDGLVLIARGP
jgi:type III pantothenate kinase